MARSSACPPGTSPCARARCRQPFCFRRHALAATKVARGDPPLSARRLGPVMGCASAKSSRVTTPIDSHWSLHAAGVVPVVPQAACDGFHCDYALDERLGSGAFGSVFAGRRISDGESVAVKIVDPHAENAAGERTGPADDVLLRMVEAEAAIMQALPRSRNVIRFYDLRIEGDLTYLVMERCTMGLLPLLNRMPLLTETTLQPIFADMISGIAACHSAGIAHRDVKCDNFLAVLCSGGAVVKLCDFGGCASTVLGDAMTLVGVCGAPPCMAPEMLHGERYSAKVDVWALGAPRPRAPLRLLAFHAVAPVGLRLGGGGFKHAGAPRAGVEAWVLRPCAARSRKRGSEVLGSATGVRRSDLEEVPAGHSSTAPGLHS